MAERWAIVRADAVVNAPSCGSAEDAIAGARARCAVDGESRAVVLVVAEIDGNNVREPA